MISLRPARWFAIACRLILFTTLAMQTSPTVADRVKDTKFSHDRGFYSQPFELKISTKTPGAQIFYTLDGSAPSPTQGTRYSEAVPIRTTCVLRAAAFKPGSKPTNVDTVSYVFPEKVLQQTGEGQPSTWGVRNGSPVVADYEVDPQIANSPTYHNRLLRGLTSLPTISLCMHPADWFAPERGIYANTMQRGIEWERPASAEWIFPAESGERTNDIEMDFQISCGVRIQGGWNRRPEESPKHSLRLQFKKKYGAGKLKRRLFPSAVLPADCLGHQKQVKSFDTLILRATNNNSWLHRGADERIRADYLRDQWMRDTFAAMGHVSSRSRFVNLFINGLYWGVYNLTERPDASFMASHFGAKPDDYDARNGDKMVGGDDVAWKELMQIVNQGISSDEAYQAVVDRIEITNFADYLLLNLYGANADYDSASNWYAGRRKQPGARYQFFVWDGERTNEAVQRNAIEYDADQSPARIFQRLRNWPAFRRLFAERVKLHCTGDGVLTPQATTARFQFHVDQIETAIVGESARWGDYRRDVHPHETGPFELYTPDRFWRVEVDRLLKDYFPVRTDCLLEQLGAVGLYSDSQQPPDE